MSTTVIQEEINAYDLRNAFQEDAYSYYGKFVVVKHSQVVEKSKSVTQ